MAQSDVSVSRGRPDEAATLAKLHVDVWRATYSAYAPQKALKLLDEEKRLPYWSAVLASNERGRGAWVARDADTIVGVVSIGSSDNPVFEGRAELKHLYVAKDAQSSGLGKRLLLTAINECKGAGSNGMALAVVRQNERARKFYRNMGGVEGARFVDPGPLWQSENVLVVWDFP
ncbi:GNAT family N-acetyltransferase [Thalassococcus sp. S3]|uniref:GNAT family N-acetyltransferase n=1 Tax=Thalassococcus sp. S3 TaxID=2017482 RepID=UPI00102D1459|nr:GNAT family N-acetyltransferase [Thalassococcus sp. S3]